MLNRLKEITLFKVKFPLNIRGVSYIILLHCFFFPPVWQTVRRVTYEILTVRYFCPFNPLTSERDWYLISPYNFTAD